jgi:hemerythrin-like domain-containing protein
MGDATATEPSDLITELKRDHARIEERVAMLVKAAEVVSRTESDKEALGVIAGTLAFFATEGARHEEVEEEILFPRLRYQPAFKQILSALEFQHRMNRTGGQELTECVERFGPGQGRELRRLAFRFADMHRGHAVAEERALFPLVASTLSSQEMAEMGRELRERKGAVRTAPDKR